MGEGEPRFVRYKIAILGIKITARTQIGMALIEYAILIGFGIGVRREAASD